jgi:hypothetical protein
MPSTTEQIITLLASIDRSLKKLVASHETPTVASDSDLDGKYGNPPVRFMPNRWTGGNFKDRPMSQCPPELLDLVAESLDWLAQKADSNGETTTAGKPVSTYKRLDAARARGWAKRLRAGWTPPPEYGGDPLLDGDPNEVDPFGGDDVTGDDIPF